MQGEITMSLRTTCLALAAAALVSQTGCCLFGCHECWPCGKDWCGSQCGELYWNEWFSLPPNCCDPCDHCGNFDGPRRNDALYSHGNDYIGYCEQTRGRQAEAVQGRPVMQSAPTPAATPRDPQPYTPGATEELPMDSTTDVQFNEFGQRISYDAPLSERARAQRVRADYAARVAFHEPVDSRGPSRKLGQSPRTRLFSR
jgi:hypothetical protein